MTKHDIFIKLLILFVGIAIMVGVVEWFDTMDEKRKPLDVSYDTIKLDSIKTTIDKRDTIIYNLNVKYKDDVEKSYSLSDSASVELFKELLAK